MNKKLFTSALLLAILFMAGFLNAQNLGNEWIVPGQNYFRFSIHETGVYRISKSELLAANVPIGDYSPKQIQLFFKGEEIPCYIDGESTEDVQFIEFYAEKNDGWFDAGMYDDSRNQVNPHYSFINDTASVFITWSSSYDNKRYKLITGNNFTNVPKLQYCYRDVLQQYTSNYYIGPIDCEYTEAEAWADQKFGLNNARNSAESVTKTIDMPNLYSGSAKATFTWGLITVSSGVHHLNVVGPGFTKDTIFGGYSNVGNVNQVAANQLQSSNDIVFSIVDDLNAETDYMAVSFVSVEYPSVFTFTDEDQTEFKLPEVKDDFSYIEVNGFNYYNAAILYDVTNQNKIIAEVKNGIVKAIVPSSSGKSKYVLTSSSAYKQVGQIRKSDFTDFRLINKSYIILTETSLLKTVNENYKPYRDAYVVNVDELYNQFGYGIQKHPLAIRNFTTFILNNAQVKPEYLFIIGKGVSASGANDFEGYRKNTTAYKNCLVPPMGNPASDVLLTAKTDGQSPVSALYMGRLSAQNSQQVIDYLNKVKEFKANEPAEWMKHAIHFGGGGNTAEQSTFASYLRNYEGAFEDTLFGGEVSTFLKTSSDPIEITQSDSVESLIEGGVSLMTFFGHGSSGGFDQNIDEPGAFDNFGKYPLLIANSCYTGNIFFPGPYSTSEDWVLIPNRGAIGFLAMSHQGIGYYLNQFSDLFYDNLCQSLYRQPLGKVINQTRQQLINNSPSTYVRNTVHEFTLHGDPAIVLNSFEKPDLKITDSSVSFSPGAITTQVDSFDVKILAKNIAKATADTFTMQITRTFQNGTVVDTQIVIDGLYYKKDISIRYPLDRINGIGLNNFYIGIDAAGEIDEISELNNNVNIPVYISSTDLIASVPYDYSLIPENPKVLKAVTGNPFIESGKSTFQLDTNYQFKSPFLVSRELEYSGGVVEWNPGVTFDQDQVYYWRVGGSEKKSDQDWSVSSFCIKENKKGWIQSDFGQLVNSSYNFIKPNASSQSFEFITTPKRLSCHNIGSPNRSTWGDIKYAIDEITDYNCCGAGAAMLLVVIDTINLSPWTSDHGEYGHRNYPKCPSRGRVDLYFVFDGNNSGLANLAETVDKYVPDGFYMLMYSFNRIQYQALSESIVRAFENWGAANFRFQPDYTPYIFYTRKGYPEESIEVLGTSETDIIDLNVDLKTNFIYGDIESSLIGPSQNWEIIEWSANQLEDNPEEEYFLRVNGIKGSGEKVLLHDSITENLIDISDISTDVYPYLRLGFFTRDELYKTPTQLNSWQVQYTPLTDLAINPQKGFEFYADTLQEGDVGKMSVAIENIGTEDADSISISYWLQNAQNQVFTLAKHRLKPLLAGQNVVDTISFNTLNHSGLMSLWINVNPISEVSGLNDQPEQNYYNNLGNKVFFVEQDEVNPLLDVTFDGVHIMDGDIVSARPLITMQLTDENRFIALDDTATFDVYLKSQQTGIESKIAVGNNDQLTFIPADLPKNKAQLIYQPEFTDDGTYELRVRAKDASGNESGAFDYQISFQVINESTITNVFNYPNPFSTSTRFVFELTGSEIPDEIRIDILTVTGKVVKIIYHDDLGPITIGKNITNYAWDGRDMYGDPLANGVYFYKVSARLNGKELKHRDTGTSKFFKNGFGKMYIMR